MFFWNKNKQKEQKGGSGKPSSGPDSMKASPKREVLIAQAKANAAAARAEIGDETLRQIREALMRKQASPLEQAKAKIKAADVDKVRDHIQFWLREEKDS